MILLGGGCGRGEVFVAPQFRAGQLQRRRSRQGSYTQYDTHRPDYFYVAGCETSVGSDFLQY